MIAGGLYCDGWAQVGYTHESGDTAREFAQVVAKNPDPLCGGNSPPTKYGAAVSTGECGSSDFEDDCALYRVVIESDGYAHTYINGTHFWANKNFKPANKWSTPFSSQFFGETFHKESNVVGTSADHVTFRRIQARNSSGSWETRGLTGASPVCRYRLSLISNSEFEIWTYPEHDNC